MLVQGKALVLAAGLLTAIVAGFSGAAASEHVESEMLVTESAVPVEEGMVDVEVGMTYTKANAGRRGVWSNNWSRSRRESFRMYEWTLRATKGLAPDTDISVETGWVDLYDREFGRAFTDDSGYHGRGMDDLNVNVKHRIFEEEGMSVAYKPGLTIPTGRHSNLDRERFGPGQNYWSLDQTLAVTKDLDEVIVNADMGYSLPFGRTRQSYKRQWGDSTRYSTADRGEDSGERGVMEANVGAVYTEGQIIQPLTEINYAHRFISRGNDSDQIHLTTGAVFEIEEDWPRLKAGYQHPLAGRNAARTRRFHLSLAHTF